MPASKDDTFHPIGSIEHELTMRYFEAERKRGQLPKDSPEWHYWNGRAEALREAAQYAEGRE